MKLPSSAIKLNTIIKNLKRKKNMENEIYYNNVRILRKDFEKAKLLNLNTQKEIQNLKKLKIGYEQSYKNFKMINIKLRKLINKRRKTLNKIKKKIKKEGKLKK